MRPGSKYITEELIGALETANANYNLTFEPIMKLAKSCSKDALRDDNFDNSLIIIAEFAVELYQGDPDISEDEVNCYHKIFVELNNSFVQMLVEMPYLRDDLDHGVRVMADHSLVVECMNSSMTYSYDEFELGFKDDQEIYEIIDKCLTELRRR